MNFLLDTHVWLWSLLEPKKLSSRVTKALTEERNELWLSPVSVWEALLLYQKKRLIIPGDPFVWIRQALQKVPLKEAFVTYDVAFSTRALHLPHEDPADRFLVATAQIYGLTLVTADDRLIVSKACPILPNQ